LVGYGIAGSSYDNSILAMLLNLGWLGTIFYAGGLALLVWSVFCDITPNTDPIVGIVRAITVSALIRLPINVPMLEASGMALWGFLGLGLAASKYYQKQAYRDERSDCSTLDMVKTN
jgi:hypothetical protein